MSVQTPPTLLKLEIQTLLRDEALAMSSLEELPSDLFPTLFKEACAGRLTNLIKAMLASWPFPCLAVGALMESPDPDWETFQTVLDGIDLRLTREFHPRRSKLQVLDLRNVCHPFWNTQADSETLKEKRVLKVLPRYALRQHLKVIIDLCITSYLHEAQVSFLMWAQQRMDSLYFCCTKMKIWSLSAYIIIVIFNVFDPEHITELELNTEWTMLQLAHFAPYFGQMRNLRKVFLAPLRKITFHFTDRRRLTETECINKFVSQFSKFNCLQHLFMDCIHFLRDQMNQVLGCLMTPLETLSITYSLISQRDLDSFSCSQSLFQLKHLDLRGVILCSLDLMPLRDLLENVADTLETLDLQGCRVKDFQLNAFLPALRQCSQLTQFKFYNNDISMPILKDFLEHTTTWSRMNVEQYPAPLECYDDLAQVSVGRFAQLCRKLMNTLRTIRQPKNISFATDICLTCGEHCVYEQALRLCHCWQ